MSGVVEDGLVAGPALRDQLFYHALVGVQDAGRSQKLRRLQLKLV